jgi:hypothetical protein
MLLRLRVDHPALLVQIPKCFVTNFQHTHRNSKNTEAAKMMASFQKEGDKTSTLLVEKQKGKTLLTLAGDDEEEKAKARATLLPTERVLPPTPSLRIAFTVARVVFCSLT